MVMGIERGKVIRKRILEARTKTIPRERRRRFSSPGDSEKNLLAYGWLVCRNKLFHLISYILLIFNRGLSTKSGHSWGEKEGL